MSLNNISQTPFSQLVFDIDGVFTDGKILYSKDGKTHKVFGPHDKDGLKIISKYNIPIRFITADKTGWDITYARIILDWKYDKNTLAFVPEETRYEWFEKNCDLSTTVFMGDGYFDAPVLKSVKLGIAPNSARIEAKHAADYVTISKAGEGAVLDACLYIENIIKNGL